MFASRLDSNLFFTPYATQLRSRAVLIASGDVDEVNNDLALPRYFSHPSPSHVVGAHFQVGLDDKNPVRTQAVRTFSSIFAPTEDPQEGIESQLARHNATSHQNLETNVGQFLKTSMNLPYKAHSVVDPLKAKDQILNWINAAKDGADKYVGSAFEKLGKVTDSSPGFHRFLGQAEETLSKDGIERSFHNPILKNVLLGFLHKKGIQNEVFNRGLSSLDQMSGSTKTLAKLGVIGLEGFLAYRIGAKLVTHLHHELGYKHAKKNASAHQNLETKVGQHLKKELDLPYEDHSVIDLKKVTEFFEKLTEKYPKLIGKPRKFLHDAYELEETILKRLANSEMKAVKLFSRAMLYKEDFRRKLDVSYLFDPTKAIGRIYRAALGVEQHPFKKIALEGLEHGTWERRFVKIGGLVLGALEVFGLYKAYVTRAAKAQDNWNRRNDVDPYEHEQRQEDRKRRHAALDAWKKGYVYDPTQPYRAPVPKSIRFLKEHFSEFNPREAKGKLKDIVRHPKDHLGVILAAGSYLGYAGFKILPKFQAAEGSLFSRVTESVGSFATKEAPAAGRIAAAVLGAYGAFTGHTWAARLGSFGLLSSTLISDNLAGRLGEHLIGKVPSVRAGLRQVFLHAAEALEFFEHSDLTKFANKARHEAEALAVGEVGEDLLRTARTLGTEIFAPFIEIPLAMLIGKGFTSIGRKIDGWKHHKKHRHHSQKREFFTAAILRKLKMEDALPFVTPAFSKSDIVFNKDYSPQERAVLSAVSSTAPGKAFLHTISPLVTTVRKVKAGNQLRRKMRIKLRMKNRDAELDPRKIKDAYARWSTYGHEGNSLNQDDTLSYGY